MLTMQGLWYSICRFCSQKFNLLVFLIGIADHTGPLVNMHRTEWWKERKKPKATLKHKANVVVRLRFFMFPTYIFGTALTCNFGTSMQCAQQPWASFLCGFHVAFHMLRLLDDIPDIKKAIVTWAARDEQHPRINTSKSKLRSPESLHGLEQDFGDSRNTSWEVHSHDFVHQNLPNQEESKKSRQELL
jgi:hypothetical protein